METSQALCERLRSKGYAITPQRRTIFEVLEGNDRHPTAEEVHARVQRKLPDVSLATVYKTLRELVSMGEVLELNYHGSKSRFDPKVHHHGHLQCERCGRLEDVDLEFPGVKLPRKHSAGFHVTRHEVVFHGICPDCAH